MDPGKPAGAPGKPAGETSPPGLCTLGATISGEMMAMGEITEGAPYGDSHEERTRELTETGSSVRHHGKPIFTALREALFPDASEPAGEPAPVTPVL